MFRMWFLTFTGTPRDHHAFEHAHEGPAVMNVPLAVLALGTLVVGFLGMPEAMGGSHFSVWLNPAVGGQAALPTPLAAGQEYDAHVLWHYQKELLLAAIAFVAGGMGIGLAYLKFVACDRPPVFGEARGLFRLFQQRWYFDHVYDLLFVRGAIDFLGWGARHVVDNVFVDGVVRGVPWLYLKFAGTVRVLQNGAVRAYAYAILLGALAILFLVMSSWSLVRF